MSNLKSSLKISFRGNSRFWYKPGPANRVNGVALAPGQWDDGSHGRLIMFGTPRRLKMTFDDFRQSLPGAKPPAELTLALAGLWWDAKGDWTHAHESAQQVEGAQGSRVHAYLHRKEGDQSNAAYWYGRAGEGRLPRTARCGMAHHCERSAGIEAKRSRECRAESTHLFLGYLAHPPRTTRSKLRRNNQFLTDRQSAGGFLPVVCAAGMNPAHSWHTMLIRERGFAVGPGMHSFTSEKRVSGQLPDGQQLGKLLDCQHQ
jgi:hypothetical protein